MAISHRPFPGFFEWACMELGFAPFPLARPAPGVEKSEPRIICLDDHPDARRALERRNRDWDFEGTRHLNGNSNDPQKDLRRVLV